MRLRRLSLQGYKTFATKTDFEFDDGITAIVGPNGSGKSNIADALRWVLGEQSYSTLRGKRTTDMIFAGSQQRARAGMAQAILTLDNSDGWLPIEFTEVEIGRRAFRSGENEYVLNGQRVRLRDVSELLAKSGLAERTYTIIGQGLVDQALSLRAEERRALFEEAAGISHYKMQRAEAMRRLEETERNLERVQDILAELRPRVGHLHRQAERAQNYDRIAADLRHHLHVWYGFQWQRSRELLRQSKQASDQAQQVWLRAREEQKKLQEQYDQERGLARQLEAEIRTLREEREELRERFEHALRQSAVLEERHKLLGNQLLEIGQDLPDLRTERVAAQRELEIALGELEAAEAALTAKQADVRQLKSSFDLQRQESERLQRLVDELEFKQRSNQNSLAQVQGRQIQLRQQLEELARQSRERDDLLRAESLVASIRSAAASAEEQVSAIRRRRDALEKQRQEKVSALAEAQAAVRRLEDAGNTLQKEYAQLETKAEMLGRLQRTELEMPEGAGLARRLLNLITIPEVYQRAAEATLVDRLDTLLVENSTSLWELFELNRERRLLAASASDLRPPPGLPLPEHPAAVGWLSELVESEEAAKPLVQLLLGRVLLVADAEAALQLAYALPDGCTTVTSNGFLAHSGGLIETHPAENEDGVLAREREWRHAQSQLEPLKASVNHHQRSLDRSLRGLAEAQAELDRLASEETDLAGAEAEAARSMNENHRNLDKAIQQREFCLREQEGVAETQRRLAVEIAELQGMINKHEIIAGDLAAQLVETRGKLELLPVDEAEGRLRALRDQVDSARTIVAGRQAVVDSRRATLGQVEDRVQRLMDRQLRLTTEYQPQELDDQRSRSAKLSAELAGVDEGLRPLQKQLRLKQEQLGQIEEMAAQLRRRAHDLETNYTQSRIVLSQRENQLESLQERIHADLGLVALDYDDGQPGQSPLPIADVVEYLPQVDALPDDTESTIQILRGQLNRMGAVNPEAPLEYEETRNRHDFLTRQLEDLRQTQDKLRHVIAELDDLTSHAFAETVGKVDAVFGDVFRRLFGGGSAQLVLTDPDDLTMSGIDIVARLPRRREQSLALLSGGERSLTAAALIFALLKVAPTPFCVLDEVDAMLDESNVNRFREMLQELSAQTQFIVITHNRGTVEAARAVYGVSMGADSASQVLSVRPEEYLKRRAER